MGKVQKREYIEDASKYIWFYVRSDNSSMENNSWQKRVIFNLHQYYKNRGKSDGLNM